MIANFIQAILLLIATMEISSTFRDFSFIKQSTDMIRSKYENMKNRLGEECSMMAMNKTESDIAIENFCKNYKDSFVKLDKIIKNGW